MSDRSPGTPVHTGRSVDRLINFSDAVVAVAVTVLVLPLLDIPRPQQGETVWLVIGDHASQLWTFLFTFYVVAVMWLAHNPILNSIGRYDAFIFWVNSTWLAAIVLLPWASAMYGESSWGSTSVGLLYWGVMAAIAFLGSLLGLHLRRRPALLSDHAPLLSPADRRRARLPLGIIPLSIWLRPAAGPAISES